jgi:hypothetical protein
MELVANVVAQQQAADFPIVAPTGGYAANNEFLSKKPLRK